jgi:hypothetical protein
MKREVSFSLLRISTIVFIAFLPYCLFAQSAKEKVTNTKWEIGLDILPLIKDTSFHMKEAIFIKRRINDNTKLRGRFGIYFDDVKNKDQIDTIWAHRPRMYFSAGIEKKVLKSSRIHVNTGFDAFVFYNRDNSYQHIKTQNAIPPTDTERFRNDRELKSGINAFVNAEYIISDHFALNIESFWQFAYRRQRFFNEEYQFGQLAQWGRSTISRFVTQLQPISSINLFYKF